MMVITVAGIAWATVDLVTVPGGIAPIWPAIGVAVAGVLLAPRSMRVPLAIAALVGEVSGGVLSGLIELSTEVVTSSAFIAGVLADLLMVTVLPPLIRRSLGTGLRFDRTHRSLLALGSITGVSVLAAVIAVLGITGIDGRFRLISVFAVGNILGVMMIVSLVVLTNSTWTVDVPTSIRRFELLANVVVITALTVLSFATDEPVAFVLFPAVIWMSIRFGPRAGLPAASFVVAYATASAVVQPDRLDSLESLQYFSLALLAGAWVTSGHALRADDERRQLRSTLEAVPDLVLVTSEDHHLLEAWPPPGGASISSRQMLRLLDPEQDDQLVRVSSTASQRRDQFFEVRSVEMDEKREVHVVRDVTRRQHSMEDLVISETKWRTMALTAFEGMIEVDADGVIQFVSERFVELLDGQGGDLVGKPYPALLDLGDWDDRWKPYLPRFLRGESYSHEITRRFNDVMQWLLVSSRPLLDTNGIRTGAVLFFADITDVREKEQARRSLEAQLAITEEEERRAIARRLHDGPIQQLVAVDLQLGLAARAFDEPNKALTTSQSTVQSTIDQLRQTLSDLVPPDVTDGHLLAELEKLARRVLSETGGEVAVSASIASHPTGNVALTLFTIGREAIINSATHGNADAIHIDLSEDSAGHTLRVTDDGIGISEEHRGGRVGHLGLRTMLERAHSMGGRCLVERGEEQGTIVTATIPHQR